MKTKVISISLLTKKTMLINYFINFLIIKNKIIKISLLVKKLF